MKINPDWVKHKDSWILADPDYLYQVRPQVTRDYGWYVYDKKTNETVKRGSSTDRIAAMFEIEKIAGYKYFVEAEYEMEKGCRCGSCMEPTGKWSVSTRDDTLYELFDSEEQALEWVKNENNR